MIDKVGRTLSSPKNVLIMGFVMFILGDLPGQNAAGKTASYHNNILHYFSSWALSHFAVRRILSPKSAVQSNPVSR